VRMSKPFRGAVSHGAVAVGVTENVASLPCRAKIDLLTPFWCRWERAAPTPEFRLTALVLSCTAGPACRGWSGAAVARRGVA